jgi:hypothetical protein
MAGRHISMGGEGSVNRVRQVIMPAELGFHRPFLADAGGLRISARVMKALSPDELGELFSERFIDSFDAANALIQEMLAVDAEAWSSDLLLRMLTAQQGNPNGGFVKLETVRDALAWDIEIPNLRSAPTQSTSERFEYAFAKCLHVGIPANRRVASFWRGGPDLADTYAFNKAGGHGQADDGLIRIYVHHEAPMGCAVDLDSHTMRVGQFEGGMEGTLVSMNEGGILTGYHPETPLADIVRAVVASDAYRCVVLAGLLATDDEPCTRETRVTEDKKVIDVFTWPSGSRTVVETWGVSVKLNGNGTDPVDRDRPTGMERCLLNRETKRTFCWGPRQ